MIHPGFEYRFSVSKAKLFYVRLHNDGHKPMQGNVTSWRVLTVKLIVRTLYCSQEFCRFPSKNTNLQNSVRP